MVEFTKEDEERYAQRLKERAERQEREAQAAAKKTQLERARPVKTNEGSPFKSRIGKGFANTLSKTADKAENLRSKADYVGSQTNRIKKALTRTPKPNAKNTMAARPYVYRPPKTRRRPSFRPQYRQSRGSSMDDLIYGSSGAESHNDYFDSLLSGKKSKRKGGDMFRGLI